jgi:hypothetical protein
MPVAVEVHGSEKEKPTQSIQRHFLNIGEQGKVLRRNQCTGDARGRCLKVGNLAHFTTFRSPRCVLGSQPLLGEVVKILGRFQTLAYPKTDSLLQDWVFIPNLEGGWDHVIRGEAEAAAGRIGSRGAFWRSDGRIRCAWRMPC